jgi:hypothetical protein
VSAYIGYTMLFVAVGALVLVLMRVGGPRRAAIILGLAVVCVWWLVTAIHLIVRSGP